MSLQKKQQKIILIKNYRVPQGGKSMKKLLPLLLVITTSIHTSDKNQLQHFHNPLWMQHCMEKELTTNDIQALDKFNTNINTIDTHMLEAPEKITQQAISAGVVGGVVAYYGPSKALKQTRFGGMEIGLTAALAVSLTLGGVYFYIGNQMNTITAFKSDLQQALEQLNQLQPQVSTLAAQILLHKEQLQQTTQTVDAIHQQVTYINEQEVDVGNFIDATENVIAAEKETREKVTENRKLLEAFYPRFKALERMITSLPKKEQEELFIQTQTSPSILENNDLETIIHQSQKPLTDHQKETIKEAIEKYNSRWFRKKAVLLSDIPEGWFHMYGYKDLIPLRYIYQ